MFNENAHNDVWNRLHKALKQGDHEAVAREWHDALPSLSRHYDDLRMLFYIGRFGLRPPYKRACETLGYLRASPPHILRYRLAIFRYAVEHSTIKTKERKHWLIEDLAQMLRIKVEDFPMANPEIPEEFAAIVAKANPPKKRR